MADGKRNSCLERLFPRGWVHTMKKKPGAKGIGAPNWAVERQEWYENAFSILEITEKLLQSRNATFMQLKENYMRNSQLKSVYNVQIGINSEYTTGIKLSSSRNVVNILRPILRRIE